jgi:hypothetical protein
VIKPRKNAVRYNALELKSIHVPMEPFDVKTNGFAARFEAYLQDRFDDLMEAEQLFNSDSFKKFELV